MVELTGKTFGLWEQEWSLAAQIELGQGLQQRIANLPRKTQRVGEED